MSLHKIDSRICYVCQADLRKLFSRCHGCLEGNSWRFSIESTRPKVFRLRDNTIARAYPNV